MVEELFTDKLQGQLGADFLSERLSADVAFADLGAEAVRHLLDWPSLSELLSTRPLAPPRLRLHRDGSPVPVEQYTDAGDVSGEPTRLLRPEALYTQLRAGASMVLDAVDRLHPPIRDATDDLMRWVRERAQVNLYVIWGDSRGFDTHWDDHDTFVVQLSGTKSWQVHGQGTRSHPMKVDSQHDHKPPDGVVWQGVLRPGQVLHVPRGWWHTVTGTGEHSMHLTFGFAPPTGVDWARSLVAALYDSELFRRDLPRFADPEAQQEHHTAMLRRLLQIAGERDLTRFFADHEDRFPRRQVMSLPWGVQDTAPDDQAVVSYVPILPPRLTRHSDAEAGRETVALSVAGRRYRLPAAAEPVLLALADHRRLPLAKLAVESGTPLAQVRGVVAALVRHHLAVLHDASPPPGG